METIQAPGTLDLKDPDEHSFHIYEIDRSAPRKHRTLPASPRSSLRSRKEMIPVKSSGISKNDRLGDQVDNPAADILASSHANETQRVSHTTAVRQRPSQAFDHVSTQGSSLNSFETPLRDGHKMPKPLPLAFKFEGLISKRSRYVNPYMDNIFSQPSDAVFAYEPRGQLATPATTMSMSPPAASQYYSEHSDEGYGPRSRSRPMDSSTKQKPSLRKVAEQGRRNDINTSLEALRKQLPLLPTDVTCSKSDLLRRAIEHIEDLHRSQDNQRDEIELMRRTLASSDTDLQTENARLKELLIQHHITWSSQDAAEPCPSRELSRQPSEPTSQSAELDEPGMNQSASDAQDCRLTGQRNALRCLHSTVERLFDLSTQLQEWHPTHPDESTDSDSVSDSEASSSDSTESCGTDQRYDCISRPLGHPNLTAQDGSNNNFGSSRDSTSQVPCSHNAEVQSSSTGRKRKFETSEGGDDDKANESDQSKRRGPPDPPAAAFGCKPEREQVQVPCFVDGCPGKDASISELIRQAAKHHSFFVCKRCYLAFEDNGEYQLHCTVGDNCEPHCVSSACVPGTPMSTAVLPLRQRHRRQTSCPSDKVVSKMDRWHYLYYLRYPDRLQCDPILQQGCSHPHGAGKPRTTRKYLKHPRPDINSIQEQLTKAKEDLREHIRGVELHEKTIAGQLAQIQRLEIVISACISLLPGGWASIPDYIQRMIRMDAKDSIPTDERLLASQRKSTLMIPPSPRSMSQASCEGRISGIGGGDVLLATQLVDRDMPIEPEQSKDKQDYSQSERLAALDFFLQSPETTVRNTTESSSSTWNAANNWINEDSLLDWC